MIITLKRRQTKTETTEERIAMARWLVEGA
jgi:hypothetical protein